MTKRLYYEDPYITEWQSTIVSLDEKADGVYLMLEETAFYPEGGGQPADRGTIGGITVLDVQSVNDEVVHKLAARPAPNTTVDCRVDWTRRFDHMQQHSGQHLLSAVCHKLLGAQTLSFHLGEAYATIDVNLPQLQPEDLDRVEGEANRLIYENRCITASIVSAEEAAALTLAKQPKVTENIRIVEMAGVEHNACGGTHVAATGAIGVIKLLKAERQKGFTRITFLCGGRALADYAQTQRLLTALARKFNVGKEAVMERVEKLEAEQKQLRAEGVEVREALNRYAAEELIASLAGKLVAQAYDNKSWPDLLGLAGSVAAGREVVVMLLSRGERKVLLSHNGWSRLDCGAVFKEKLPLFGGKGGGSAAMAQGAFADAAQAEVFFATLSKTLGELID
jgi:alanyl-tRNA synthetase